MAEEKRVVYTYTGQSTREYGICTLNLSQFTITEGEAPSPNIPFKITRFTVDYMRRHDTTATVKYHMEIEMKSKGDRVQSSTHGVTSEKNAWNSIQHTLLYGMPWFLDSTTQIRLVPDNNVNDVAWIASSNYPITITVLYATSIYEPSISDATIYRSTANGIKDDTGTYLSYSANVKAGSVGSSSSSGTLKLRRYEPEPTSTSYVYVETVGSHTVATSTSSTTISNNGEVSFPLTNSGYFRFELSYREESEPYYTETVESPMIYVPRSFVNVHLAGTKGGGVCLGGYSSADASTPKFESYYSAYLYSGVEQIGEKNAEGSLWTEFAESSLQNGATTPAAYGCSLRMRKIEGKCIIRGSVMIKPGSGTIVIANLPEGYKPMHSAYKLAACQGARIARIAVYGASDSNSENYGKLVLEWVRDLSDGDLYTSAAIWVDCSIEYWVNDIEET